MSALTLVDCGFNLQLGYSKDFKNGSHCLPAVELGKLDHPMIPQQGTPLGDGSNVEDKFCILRDVTFTGTLNIIQVEEHLQISVINMSDY